MTLIDWVELRPGVRSRVVDVDPSCCAVPEKGFNEIPQKTAVMLISEVIINVSGFWLPERDPLQPEKPKPVAKFVAASVTDDPEGIDQLPSEFGPTVTGEPLIAEHWTITDPPGWVITYNSSFAVAKTGEKLWTKMLNKSNVKTTNTVRVPLVLFFNLPLSPWRTYQVSVDPNFKANGLFITNNTFFVSNAT